MAKGRPLGIRGRAYTLSLGSRQARYQTPSIPSCAPSSSAGGIPPSRSTPQPPFSFSPAPQTPRPPAFCGAIVSHPLRPPSPVLCALHRSRRIDLVRRHHVKPDRLPRVSPRYPRLVVPLPPQERLQPTPPPRHGASHLKHSSHRPVAARVRLQALPLAPPRELLFCAAVCRLARALGFSPIASRIRPPSGCCGRPLRVPSAPSSAGTHNVSPATT